MNPMDWAGALLSGLGTGAGNIFRGVANWDPANDQGVGRMVGGAVPSFMGIGAAPIKAAADIGDLAGQLPNPLNGGKPLGGPPNSTLSPAPNGGMSQANQAMQQFPNSSLSLSPGAMGKGSYFNPDDGDTAAGYNSLLLQGGMNPMTSAVGRFASGQAGRMNSQYDLGLASGAVSPGMSMEDFQRQFINSGGVGTSSDLRPVLQRGQQLVANRMAPTNPQDVNAIRLYMEVQQNPSMLGQLVTDNLPYAMPHSDLYAKYLGQAARLNQSANPNQLTDFVQAYLNGQ